MSSISELLRRVQEHLDIPEKWADEAAAEYRRVAEWLGAVGSPLREYDPDLYPQGSFRLGTPVRPIAEGDDFDIDLVCRLAIKKEQTTQRDLKEMVGQRLQDDPTLAGRLRERRRCWELSYRPRYHMDVLPSIPDEDGTPVSILLTDKELHRWQFSNPIGYAEWFYERMKAEWEEARRVLAESIKAGIEDVPEWKVRTSLQRAVQLLKRHRDVRFSDEPELRPVSIILTTLAGQAYRPRLDLARTVLDLVERMPTFIEQRDGVWWVENPAQPRENFADKWNEHPERREAFLQWLRTLREDIGALEAGSDAERYDLLEERFIISLEPGRSLVEASTIPALEDFSHAKPPPWPLRERYECRITAKVQFRKGGPFVRMGRYVPKECQLRFVADSDAPRPFEVHWQIVNTGIEARRAGNLRGGFYDEEGPRGTVRHEHTRYLGTHLVRAFVVAHGIVVAAADPVHVRIASRHRRT